MIFMEKILTIGIENKTKILLENLFPDFGFVHTEYSVPLPERIMVENPVFVIMENRQENPFISVHCRQLKNDNRTKQIPLVILFDKRNSDTESKKIFEAGADAFLSKPLDQWESVSLFRLLLKNRDLSGIGNPIESSKEGYRNMFENNPQPMWIYDQETLVFLKVNAAAVAHYGYSKQEFLSMTLKDIRPREDIVALLSDVENTHKTYNLAGEWRHVKKDGEVIFVEIISHSLVFEGRLARQVLVKDVTDRKMTEKALKESEERWKFALEGAGDGIWDWDLQNNQIFFSNQWKAMLGYQPEEIKNEFDEWEKRVHPDDLAKAYEDIQKHLNGETAVYQNEHRLRFKDGSYRWILDRGKIISFDKNGKPVRFVGIHTDITDRKLSEELLRENEERYRKTLDSMLEGCQIIGSDWRYIYINDSAEKQNQRPKKELLGNRYMDMWPGIEETVVFEKIKRCIEQRLPEQLENLFMFPDGASGWFELSIQPVPEGVFILSIDITERKKTEEALRKLKDELEEQVEEKTKELKDRVLELERFQDATIEREFRIKELRDELQKLKERI
jgi:PAS domain S-box-containing protein